MAGDTNLTDVLDYLSRLRGAPIAAGQLLTLRSVERAAFAAWIRKTGLQTNGDVLASSAPFTVEQILSDGERSHERAPDIGLPKTSSSATQPSTRVGVDIELVDALPHAGDYRDHPFYEDNFTAKEIAYCLRQADVRASFCGTWAAKEAILKSGIIQLTGTNLRAIEISRDPSGRPVHPECSISISHTPSTAVAVCLA
ncbi:holo-ACP synthase [Beijerinckia sp. L45]|uniref:holo-ACP synthase n=1 Tax=Beijerinckia sp. L45 TaxID=1641855 RepID=UPI00131BB9AB|nr:4'-phosphopantetheinyl transferase superfamily protein [Beijerinckia sp. L45]